MNEVLAITAFLMALGAVFLANDAVRKAEHKNEAFIKNHVDKLMADIGKNSALIKQLQEALVEQEKQLTETVSERTALKEQISLLKEGLAKADADISELRPPQVKKPPRKNA